MGMDGRRRAGVGGQNCDGALFTARPLSGHAHPVRRQQAPSHGRQIRAKAFQPVALRVRPRPGAARRRSSRSDHDLGSVHADPHSCIKRSAHPGWSHLRAQKPLCWPRTPGLSWFSTGPEAPVLLLWIMARTPVALMQQCRLNRPAKPLITATRRVLARYKPRGLGRCRMAPLADASAKSLRAFVADHVEPGAMVITDAWQGYHGLEELGYVHDRRSQRAARACGEDPGELLPAVHRVASLIKRWLPGTHQGSVEAAHLPSYLNEFVFRFNRRRSRSRGLVFYRVLELAIAHDRVVGRPADPRCR